jgi:hypothetical protein
MEQWIFQQKEQVEDQLEQQEQMEAMVQHQHSQTGITPHLQEIHPEAEEEVEFQH